ncbi:MAG: polysaccharide deacetylase family protein [Clostridia bacterium]|nr:polysaccharide deacetylase family protein [Clostridia bacterium]
MYTKSKRCGILVLVLMLAVLFCTLFSLATRADSSLPTLYCNDEVWYKAKIVPLRIYHSVYVPISVFEQIEGVTVTFYERNNTAMIYRSESQYISFDFNRNSASVQENERFYLMTYEEDNERYVPLVTTCEYLDLQCETYTSALDGSISARICDGRQTKTFEELLRRYNPAALDGDIDTSGTGDITSIPVSGERVVFLTIDGLGDGDRIPALLDLFEEYSIKVTFFITPQELTEQEETVLSILAGGHTLGFLVERDSAEEELAAANARLMLRFKRTTRLYRLADGELSVEEENTIANRGYACWTWNYDLGVSEDTVRQTLIAFRRALRTDKNIVLRAQPDGFNTVGYLREFFNSAEGTRAFLPLTPAYYAEAILG